MINTFISLPIFIITLGRHKPNFFESLIERNIGNCNSIPFHFQMFILDLISMTLFGVSKIGCTMCTLISFKDDPKAYIIQQRKFINEFYFGNIHLYNKVLVRRMSRYIFSSQELMDYNIKAYDDPMGVIFDESMIHDFMRQGMFVYIEDFMRNSYTYKLDLPEEELKLKAVD